MLRTFVILCMLVIALSTQLQLVVSQDNAVNPSEPEWKFKSQAALDAKQRYDTAMNGHKAAYQKASAEAGKVFLAELATVQKDATQAGNLDEAIAIRSAIEQAGTLGIGKEVAVPSSNAQPTYLTVLDEKVISADKEHGLGKNGSLFKAKTTINVGGKPSPRGLGLHGVSKDTVAVEYNLQGKYKTFLGSVAIDDFSLQFGGNKTPLVFKVLGDNKVLWSSDPVRAPGKSFPFKIPVAGVKTLKLAVVCAGDAYGAQAVWLEPRLE